MGGDSTLTRQRGASHESLHSDLKLPKQSPRSKSSETKKKRRSKSSNKDQPHAIPEDESCLPGDLPDMNWGAAGQNRDSVGSTNTAATMDSSSGSMDSSGRRRREKPDMDWGSHAKTQNSDENGMRKSKSDRGMGYKGSGHAGKSTMKRANSNHETEIKRAISSKKKELQSKGGSGHLRRPAPKGSTSPNQGLKKSLSGSNMMAMELAKPKSVKRIASTGRAPKSPKSPGKSKKPEISPLLQLVAMDENYTGPPPETLIADEDSGEDQFNESSEEEGSDSEHELGEEEELHRKRSPKRSNRDKQKRAQSHDGAPKRKSGKGQRKPKRSQTMQDPAAMGTIVKRRQTISDATGSRRRQKGVDAVPPTPKGGRKARAHSILTRSPTQEDNRRGERNRRNISIHEQNGLVTPRRQGRRSIATMSPERQKGRQLGALPMFTDLDSNEDFEDQNALLDPKPKPQRRGRRASLGARSNSGSNLVSHSDSLQKVGSRRGLGAPRDDTFHGLVTPRRASRKLSVVSPFEHDANLAHEDDNGEEEHPGDSLLHGRPRDNEDDLMGQTGRRPGPSFPSNTPRRRRDVSTRRASANNLDDDEDGSIDSSERSRRRQGPRRSQLDNKGGRRSLTSLRGLDRLKADSIEEDGDNKSLSGRSTKSEGANLPRGSRRNLMDDSNLPRGSRRNLMDDSSVSSVGRRASGSRTGRYGYGDNTERLCLSAVPSQPKKSVGSLAALLYRNPLDLAMDDGEDDKEDKNEKNDDEDSVLSEKPEPAAEEQTETEKPVDKVQAKKDYWKAKLASSK